MITTQHSRFETNNVKYNKGFSILEVLIAAFILSFISLTIFKTLDISILSSNLSNSLVSDADLKIAIHNVLKPEQCKRNLHPDNLNDISSISKTIKNSLKKYNDPTNPSDTSGVELIKINERFRDYLDIVKIELAGPDTDTQRAFTVYYKRNRVKHLGTKNNGVCDATDDSGCYKNTCNLEYEVTGTDVTTCNVLDCFTLGSSISQPVDPRLALFLVNEDKQSYFLGEGAIDKIEGIRNIGFGYLLRPNSVNGNNNTFFGSETARNAKIEGNGNMFFGTLAGNDAEIYGAGNMFLGFQSGGDTKIGESGNWANHNHFVGYRAGWKTEVLGYANTFLGMDVAYDSKITGSGNIFLGTKAGSEQTQPIASSHNINIGNTLLMKSTSKQLDSSSYNVPNNEVWINGNLKVCDVNGNSGSCKAVASNSELQASKTKIQTLESTVQNLEMTIQNLQNEINTLKSHTH